MSGSGQVTAQFSHNRNRTFEERFESIPTTSSPHRRNINRPTFLTIPDSGVNIPRSSGEVPERPNGLVSKTSDLF